MEMNDMVIISVDDHICEPPDMFDKHLSGEALATAPKLRTDENGTNYWEYQGMKTLGRAERRRRPAVPRNMAWSRPSLEQLRKGCYDVHARIDDMDVNGIAASLNFGNSIGFDGAHLPPGARQEARAHAPARLQRLADRRMVRRLSGPLHSVRHPADLGHGRDDRRDRRARRQGLHRRLDQREPDHAGSAEHPQRLLEPVLEGDRRHRHHHRLHIGTGNPAPHASMETPIEAWITTMPMSIAQGAADWLQLEALQQLSPDAHRTVRRAASAGCRTSSSAPISPTGATRPGRTRSSRTKKPSDTFKRHFLNCFIDDAFGLKNLEDIGEDMVAYECDYPHSDTLWPEAPERLWEIGQAPDRCADRQGDAQECDAHFRFDPFKHYKREELTVGALRATAKAGVSIPRRSLPGAPARWRARSTGHFGRHDGDVRVERTSVASRRRKSRPSPTSASGAHRSLCGARRSLCGAYLSRRGAPCPCTSPGCGADC